MKELDRLRLLHPHATIIYADYYNAALQVFRSPLLFGLHFTLPLYLCNTKCTASASLLASIIRSSAFIIKVNLSNSDPLLQYFGASILLDFDPMAFI